MEKLLRGLSSECARLAGEGRQNEAIFDLERVIVECLNVAALTRYEAFGDLRRARKYFEMALKISPGNWMLYSNLSHLLNRSCNFEEAKEAVLKAVEYCEQPLPDCYYNAGVILGNLYEFDRSVEFYREAIRLEDRPKFRYNLASALLTLGRWEEGWAAYESRFEAFPRPKEIKSRFSQPMWDGGDLRGKTILVFSEQGAGDLIQFCRYLPLLKAKKVFVEAQELCADLIEKNFRVTVIPRGDGKLPDPPKGLDVVTSCCSLPGIFHPKIPEQPYLKSTQKRKKLGDGFKVGICWAGNPDHSNDFVRSCTIWDFAALFDVPGVKFYSFQKGNMSRKWDCDGFVNLGTTAGQPVTDLAPECNSFSDTAAFVKEMDLIITVDTGLAHLAGAMGKPVWNLIAYLHDWRWRTHEFTSSPWYPTMRLFRQPGFRQWGPVFQAVRQQLVEALPLRASRDTRRRSASKAG